MPSPSQDNGITPIQIVGLGTLEQRAYLLMSMATGGLTNDAEKHARARTLLSRLRARYPQFAPSSAHD